MLTLVLMIGSPVWSLAQRGQRHNHEKIKAAKIGFITEKLSLSTEQAQKFWPIFNQYEQERHQLRGKIHSLHQQLENPSQHSDQQLEKLMAQLRQSHNTMASLYDKYHPQFLTVLSIKQLASLYNTEHEFKRFLLNRLGGEGRGKGRGGMPPPH